MLPSGEFTTIAVMVVSLALIAWLIIATLGGLRGREPYETDPGTLMRRVKALEERVERLERGNRDA